MPMNPRAPPKAPAAGWPAKSTSMVPFRNNASFTRAYEAAFWASALAMTWTALRPLKLVWAMDTFFATKRSALWAASGRAMRVHSDARMAIGREAGLFIGGWVGTATSNTKLAKSTGCGAELFKGGHAVARADARPTAIKSR